VKESGTAPTLERIITKQVLLIRMANIKGNIFASLIRKKALQSLSFYTTTSTEVRMLFYRYGSNRPLLIGTFAAIRSPKSSMRKKRKEGKYNRNAIDTVPKKLLYTMF
jgi:hypothetical protein